MSDKNTAPKTAESEEKQSSWTIQWYITIP